MFRQGTINKNNNSTGQPKSVKINLPGANLASLGPTSKPSSPQASQLSQPLTRRRRLTLVQTWLLIGPWLVICPWLIIWSLAGQRSLLYPYMSNICQIYVKYTSTMCQIYVKYMSNICQIYVKYTSNIRQIYVKYMSNICHIYVKYTSNICQIYVKYMSCKMSTWN